MIGATTAAVRAAATAFVLALAAGACGDNRKPPTAATPPPVVPAYVTPAQAGEVVGHLRIADPAALLAKLEALVPASLASELDPEAARALLGAVLPVPSSQAVSHLSLTRAAACAVLDPAQRRQPLVCIAGYDGGMAQLAADVGPDGVLADDQAALHIRRGTEDWFFDPLGEHVVFARQADAFEVARPTLVALSHPGSERDLEVVLHTSHIVRRNRSALAKWLGEQANAAKASAPTSALTRAIVKHAGSAVGLQAVAELLGVLEAVDRVELYASVASSAVTVGLGVVSTPGSAVREWIDQSEGVDPAMWPWLPNGTWLTWAGQRHRGGPLLPHTRRLFLLALGEFVGESLGRTAGEFESAARSLGDAQGEVYGDWTLMAAFNSPAARGGAMLVRPVLPGVDARTTWLALGTAATPRAVFGDALGAKIETLVSWSVVPHAKTVHGLTVDEWRLTAAPGLLDAMEQRLDATSVGQQIIAALREREALVSIQRFDLEGAVAMVFAPGGSPSYASKVIRARQGEGRLSPAGVQAAIGQDVVPQLLAISGFDLVRGLREMVPTELRPALPKPVGRDLSDAYLRVRVGGGIQSHELVISSFALGLAVDAVAATRGPATDL